MLGICQPPLQQNLGDSARALTADNTQKFITAAPLGAVVRIVGCSSGCSGFSGDSCSSHSIHSLMLVAKSSSDCTFLERQGTGVYTSKYTWSQFASYWTGAGCKYFKYIKWPGARNATDAEATQNLTCVFTRDSESRHDPYDVSPVTTKYTQGSQVQAVGSAVNMYNNTWYRRRRVSLCDYRNHIHR